MQANCDEFKPAKQPAKAKDKCEAWVFPNQPANPKPPDYKYPCDCGNQGDSSQNCLETLIEKQTNEIIAAEKKKPLKAELEAILAKAKAAEQEYTIDKYQGLLKEWQRLDELLIKLLKNVTCSFPHWKCILECHICPLIREIDEAEHLLGDSNECRVQLDNAKKYNLIDLKNWCERDRAIKQRRLQRIANVLKAWEKPAATIEGVLQDNSKLIDKLMGSADPKVLIDIFFKLIPKHLAIAPPAETATTKIDARYTQFCEFDTGCQDDCCGPDVGAPTIRQRLIGSLPHLIEPSQLGSTICCLAGERYLKAMEQLASAEGAVVSIEERIKRERTRIEKGFQNFDADARSRMPSTTAPCNCNGNPANQNAGRPDPQQQQQQDDQPDNCPDDEDSNDRSYIL